MYVVYQLPVDGFFYTVLPVVLGTDIWVCPVLIYEAIYHIKVRTALERWSTKTVH